MSSTTTNGHVNGHQPSQKVALITGGASGIGHAVALHFAAQGYRIAILDVDGVAGPTVAASLTTDFPASAASFTRCDVTSWQQQRDAFAEMYGKYGRLDVVMANAGISEQGALSLAVLGEKEPSEPTLRTLNVNLVGILYSVKLAVYYMQKNGIDEHERSRGSIICTASNAGIYPFPVAPLYSASKAGVIGLVRSMARPLERAKIQINALAPAVVGKLVADRHLAPALMFFRNKLAPDKSLLKAMIITPMQTLTRGVAQIIANPDLTGAVAEIHGESVTLRPHQEYVDEESRKNLEMFWTLGYA